MADEKAKGMVTCLLCGYSGEQDIFRAREMQFGTREEFNYFNCGSCECLQIEDVPEDLSIHYPQQYYSTKALKEERYRGLRGWVWKQPYQASMKSGGLFSSLLRSIKAVPHFSCLQSINLKPEDRILDVGCGNGKHFLYPLVKLGFSNAMGCDPFLEKDIQYENGLKIKKASVEDIDEGGGNYDAIFFHHSFEHVVDPLLTLRATSTLMNSESICVIRIPVSSSWAWKSYGVDWYQLDAPRHLFLHSEKSMKLLGDKVGLEIERVEYDSNYMQFHCSENYARDIALLDQRKGKGISWQLKRARLNNEAKRLNGEAQGDQAAFFFRKKPESTQGGVEVAPVP